MDEAHLPRLLRIFDQARSLAPEARARFLSAQCGVDATLRAEVEALLSTRAAATGVLDRPAQAICSSVDADALLQADREDGAHRLHRGEQVGRYRLLRVLGEGGMGRVWEAEQSEPLIRRVALKRMRRESETVELLTRFEAERQTLATLDHANIAAVYDAGADSEGHPYYVMELVAGQPIDRFCDEHRLNIAQRLSLVAAVCRAVEHAHRRGVLHRDLKPSNVLVAEDDDGAPVPKIIDFGIAKALAGLEDPPLATREGSLIGTPEFMSPEQAAGWADIDTRTDVYALGVLLYRVLAGVLPFSSERLRGVSPVEVHRILTTEEAPPPSVRLAALGEEAERVAERRGTDLSGLRRVLSGELRWVLAKALARDRSERYGSASELATELERYLRAEPLEAGPPSRAYRAMKFARRHRLAVGMSAALVLSLAAGLVVSLLLLHQASRARADAERQTATAEAVNRFLNEDVLGAAIPQREGDNDLEVSEMLTRAAAKLDQGFDGPREVEATLHRTLGKAYFGLGRLKPAAAQLERSLQLQLEALGPEDNLTLETQLELARTLIDASRLDDAKASIEEGLEHAERGLGPDHVTTIAFLRHRGMVQLASGALEEAETTYREVLTRIRRVAGEDSPMTAAAMDSLSAVLEREGRPDIGLTRQVVDILQRTLGDDNKQTAFARLSLGAELANAGELEEAESVMRRALEQHRSIFGDHHARTLQAERLLAGLLHRTGRLDEALQLAEHSYAGNDELLGAEAIQTLLARGTLAKILAARGDLETAYAHAVEVARIAEASLPPGHDYIGRFLLDEGEVLTDLGRWEEARGVLLRAQGLLAKLGPEHRFVKEADEALADLRAQQDRGPSPARSQAAD